MTKTITKKQIIKALQIEPRLEHNFWFRPISPTYSNTRLQKPCAVCAVGCVLRAMSFEAWAKKNRHDPNSLGLIAVKSNVYGRKRLWRYAVNRLLHDKNYLAALSVYFESGNGRKKCMEFVEQNFPDKLTVKILKSDLQY